MAFSYRTRVERSIEAKPCPWECGTTLWPRYALPCGSQPGYRAAGEDPSRSDSPIANSLSAGSLAPAEAVGSVRPWCVDSAPP